MKKNARSSKFLIYVASFLISFTLAGNFNVSSAEIKLRYSSFYMPKEPPDQQANYTLDLIEKRTEGKIKFERYNAGTLGGPLEQLEIVSHGSADLTSLQADLYPQQLPLYQINYAEQFVSPAQALARANALTKEIKESAALFEKEEIKNNIKIMSFYAQGPIGVTARFNSESLSDVKGKKINTCTAYQKNYYKELGWIPVNIQIPELYEALSRGVIDTIWMTTAAIISRKWHEIGKTHYNMGSISTISCPLAFNLDVWNRIPKELQNVIIESSKEASQWSIQLCEKNNRDTYEQLEKAGCKIISITEEEKQQLSQMVQKHFRDHYLKLTENAGVSSEAKQILKSWDEYNDKNLKGVY